MALLVTPLANHLATFPQPYVVRSGWTDTVDYDRLVELMATGRTTLTKPDIAGCLELFIEELGKLLADGRRVKTKLGSFYVCASGKLSSRDQSFTPGEGEGSHELRLHFKPDRDFEAGICAAIQIERGRRYDRFTPVIDKAVSARTEAEMSASAGDMLRVEGEKLKFDKANQAEGLFFVNGQETRVAQYALIQPSQLIVQVPPELAAGSYVLALRSMQGTKELHEGRSAKPFVIG